MNDRKKIGFVLFAGLVVLSAMVVLATPAVAQEYDPWATNLTLDDPSLWLYIEGGTYNPKLPTVGDDWIAQSWVNPVEFSHGDTYTDYVDVIAHNKENYAVNPYFFVWFTDNTLIEEIIVGKAQTFILGVEESCDPHGCSPETTFQPGDFVDSLTQTGGPLDPDPRTHQGQTGYWVKIRIGNVSTVPDFLFGNPTEGTWDPTKLKSYVKVPVTYTLTSDTTKDLTQLIIHYDAHNTDSDVDGALQSNTANSHDSSSYNVPEFSTIAIPVAAVLGLLFFFNHRKKRGE